MYYVYILESIDAPERHYTGLTRNIDTRRKKHNAGQVFHTAKYAPWRLETYMASSDREKIAAFKNI